MAPHEFNVILRTTKDEFNVIPTTDWLGAISMSSKTRSLFYLCLNTSRKLNGCSRLGGQLVVWLGFRPVDGRVAGLIPDSTNFLTNSSGQATNALVSLITKQ